MEKRREHKKWKTCPTCHMMVYASNTLGNHRCPEKVRALRDFELDMVVDAELETWDQDVKKFWKNKDTQFNVWLANHRRL